MPAVEECASIVPHDNGLIGTRCLEFRNKDGTPSTILTRHFLYNILSHPLVHWKGNFGWHLGLKKTNFKRLTLSEYTCYHLYSRVDVDSAS